jgi:glycosyltransferase involved in cell wall biosynthesis
VRGVKEKAVPGACAIVPALDAAATVGAVVDGLRASLGVPVLVVDDGSTDATGQVARDRGAFVLRSESNQGKGEAIRTGLREAARRGLGVAVTVDADGQHPAESARTVLDGSDDPLALVLGVRDLSRDRAPRANRFGNAVSNFFLSRLTGRALRDTQCGLRRYPIAETLELGVRSRGYAFEAEVLLRAVASGLQLVEIPVAVIYPREGEGGTHFRLVHDPVQIVATVAWTALELRIGFR